MTAVDARTVEDRHVHDLIATVDHLDDLSTAWTWRLLSVPSTRWEEIVEHVSGPRLVAVLRSVCWLHRTGQVPESMRAES